MIPVDPHLFFKAQQLGLKKLYDANFDGRIDGTDLQILAGKKVMGVFAKLGTPEAIKQFGNVEANASKSGYYRGKSLLWGGGGRSLLLQDRLLVSGKTLAEAQDIVSINFFAKMKVR